MYTDISLDLSVCVGKEKLSCHIYIHCIQSFIVSKVCLFNHNETFWRANENEIDEVEHHHNHDEIFCCNGQFHQRNHHHCRVYHGFHVDVDRFCPCYIRGQSNDDNLFAYLHHGVHDNHSAGESSCCFVGDCRVVDGAVVGGFAVIIPLINAQHLTNVLIPTRICSIVSRIFK